MPLKCEYKRVGHYIGNIKLPEKLSDIENNRSNSSVAVLNKVFKLFDLNVGLIPISPSVLQNIINDGDDDDDFAKYFPE